MNILPESYTHVSPDKLTAFVAQLAQAAGMPAEKSAFLAGLLVRNDLRGVFSHGTRQMATYARIMRDGLINPNPAVHVVRDSPATLLVDGDGGLGYFPAYEAAKVLVERCRVNGVAVAVTRNHGHIGAAGIYSRYLAEQGLIGYVTSGHQLSLSPDQSIMNAAGGSPMSFAVPAETEPSMVLDFGAMHDLYADSPHVRELFDLAPGLVFRSMGLGFMCQALGGFLAGVPVDEERAQKTFKGANQGSLIIALDASRFIDPAVFKREMDTFIARAREMRPMPGHERASVPGVLESEREQAWAQSGVPVDEDHRETLENTAREFGLTITLA